MNNDKKIIIAGLVITVILIIVVAIFLSPEKNEPQFSKDEIVASDGLHWHPTLEIFIEGKRQEIPANIGILPTKHEEIHTHDQDAKEGIIHMEMRGAVIRDETRLGRFFEIWGKKFNSTQIFELKNSSESSVKMFVNGKENKEFEKYLMQDKDKIEIRYD